MLLIKWPKPTLSVIQLIIATALFLACFDNLSFFQAVFKLADQSAVVSSSFKISIVIALIALFTVLLSIFSNKYLFKPFVIIILLTAAVISFFMDTYGVIIDSSMIQNLFETNAHEVWELLNVKLLMHIFFWGVCPAWLVYFVDIQYQPFLTELLRRLGLIAFAVVVFAGVLFSHYKELSFLDRNNRHLRQLINPNHAIYALQKYLKHKWHPKVTQLRPLGLDAKQSSSWQMRGKKTLLVLVVGETARAKNFSLNGYSELTNRQLVQQDIINFTNTYSCGTATAASVPCMFSQLERKNYNEDVAKNSENLLDVLTHAGISVLWRDNNSGCKGVCDRVPTLALENLKVPDLCSDEECYDEILLHDLQAVVDKLPNDSVIVLHQKGSHGPAYYKRHPDNFKIFTPECSNTQVQDCPQAEIVHAYDNTIAYTDHVLAQVIQFLQKNANNYHTAMLYMSDHGESLGENGIYLHGLPYSLAPDEQKHIPFILWLSPGYTESFGVNTACLKQRANLAYSHDNLFHSVLGMLNVTTSVYNKDLDVLAGCR